MNDIPNPFPLIIIGILIILILSSCASNPCVDNPRMMSCMSASELERELNKI